MKLKNIKLVNNNIHTCTEADNVVSLRGTMKIEIDYDESMFYGAFHVPDSEARKKHLIERVFSTIDRSLKITK